MNTLSSIHFTSLKNFVNKISALSGAILDCSSLDSLFAYNPLDEPIAIFNHNLIKWKWWSEPS